MSSTAYPKDCDQEVATWRDWWWIVFQYPCTLDSSYESELKYIEAHPTVEQDPGLMNEAREKRSLFLYMDYLLQYFGDACSGEQWL